MKPKNWAWSQLEELFDDWVNLLIRRNRKQLLDAWQKPCEPEIEAACDAWCRETARDIDALGTTRPPKPLLAWIFRRLSFAYGLARIYAYTEAKYIGTTAAVERLLIDEWRKYAPHSHSPPTRRR